MEDTVVDLAARCAVGLYSGTRFLGSGFFIAPGQVLTCAHVAAEGRESLTVRWGGRELSARPRQLIPPQAGPGPTYAPPDLALVTVEAGPDQPFAWLAETGPAAGATVVCLGFSAATPGARVAVDSVVFQVAAASGDGLVKVQGGELPLGMSGSLALDLETQRVCGMIKASRDPSAPRGGWIIPVPVIAEHLGPAVELNQAGHWPASPWRLSATRYADFARRLFRSPSPLRVAGQPVNAPPSWWLDPRHRATEFQERPELAALLSWAVADDPATPVARLVTGEGGSGKTRLAVEIAARLTGRGWTAGLLTPDDLGRLPVIAEALHEVLAYGHRVFIALDYPEGMGDEVRQFLAQLPLPDEGTVRVLLLARFGGGWWDAVDPSGEIKYLIDRTPVRLAPLGAGPQGSLTRFGEALHDYRAAILGSGAPAGAVPPALAEAARRQATALKLHALALAAVLHERDHGALPSGEAGWSDPLLMLVAHERKHWREAARGRALAGAADVEWSGRVLLVPTLLSVYRREDAAAAVGRVPGLAERFPGEAAEAAVLLRDLYPPDESASLRWWSPLPLDRIGETLLATVFERLGESAGAYVAALLGAASPAETISGLTVMSRVAADQETTDAVRALLNRCLDSVAAADGWRLLPALLVADRQVPPGAERPGERQLRRLEPATVLSLVARLSQDTAGGRPLQETGLLLLDHAEGLLDRDETQTADVPQAVRETLAQLRDSGISLPTETSAHLYAKALRADLLLRLRRPAEALAPAEAAARSLRATHRASSAAASGPVVLVQGDLVVSMTEPGNYAKPLLHVLGTYAEALETVGRVTEAAEVRRECVAVARQAAGNGDPDAAQIMATQLTALAEIMLDRGEAEQAEPLARDAVVCARSLPGPLPQASALALWAKALDRCGKPAHARAVAADAVRMLREAAREPTDSVNVAQVIRYLGDLAPSDAMGSDILAELRSAESSDPAGAIPAFIRFAIGRTEELAGRGDTAGARRQMAETLARARRLGADDPATNLHIVAYVLYQGASLGCTADPVADIAEAAGIFRRLAGDYGRDDVLPDLALMLLEHSLRIRDAGRDADAVSGFADAVELLRGQLASDRWRNTPYLSTALALFAEAAAKHGDPRAALAAAREAIDLELTRTDDFAPSPAVNLPRFRRILITALAMVAIGGRQQAAVDTAVRTALLGELCRVARGFPPGELDPEGRGIFTSALGMLSIIHSESDHPEDALPVLDEAIGLLRQPADDRSGGRGPRLLLQLGNSRASICRTGQRHAQAVRATSDLLADCRDAQPACERERQGSVMLAMQVLRDLPRPAFTAEAFQLLTDVSRTCREWLPRGTVRLDLVAAAVKLLHGLLSQAAAEGSAPQEWPSAVAELSASVQVLAEEAPALVRGEQVQALTHAAGLLATNHHQVEEALVLNTRALELYQAVGGDDGQLGPTLGIAALVQRGVILSGMRRYEDAITPLEQALPVLLAAGAGISAPYAMLLSSTVDLLRQAYQALGRDAALTSLIEAFHASGVPPVIPASGPGGIAGTALTATLRAAEQDAGTDPERAFPVFSQLLLSPAGLREYIIARAACARAVTTLNDAGRYPDALRLCDLLITTGSGLGIGAWAQLDGQARRVGVQFNAGHDPQAILAEVTALTARADELMAEAAAHDGIDPEWVKESLLRSGARAALWLQQWPDALRLAQAEAGSMRARGARPPEVAVADFTSYTPLVAMGRTAEAAELLDRCEAAFSEVHERRNVHLALVTHARADQAARAGDPGRAVRLQCGVLASLYEAREVRQIERGHAALSRWCTMADLHSALALAHALAAAVLARLLGQAPDTEAVARAMMYRAGGYPATLAELSAAVDETPGLRFTELAESLTRAGAAPAPTEVYATLLRQARDTQRALFRELAEQRVQWDPVFAGIAAARGGDLAAARSVAAALAGYADDEDWSHLAAALGHVFRQHPERALAVPLDGVDAVMLRRCTDVLDGEVRIHRGLAQAIPLSKMLAEVLHAAWNNQGSPVLARALEVLAGEERWRPLVPALRSVLAGERGPRLTEGLDQANAVIVGTLVGHLVAP